MKKMDVKEFEKVKKYIREVMGYTVIPTGYYEGLINDGGKDEKMKEPVNLKEINEISTVIVNEFIGAGKKFLPFNSAHEGYAVLKEEMDEMWDVIKKTKFTKNPTEEEKSKIADEAIQIGAMAMKMISFLYNSESSRTEKIDNEKFKAEKKTELEKIFGKGSCDGCPDIEKCKEINKERK